MDTPFRYQKFDKYIAIKVKYKKKQMYLVF